MRRLSVGVGRAGLTDTDRNVRRDGQAETAAPTALRTVAASSRFPQSQPNLPAGWTGGNRIAIHGTLSASDFGRAVSAGCVHASDSDLRYLMRTVPLGTPVVIRP